MDKSNYSSLHQSIEYNIDDNRVIWVFNSDVSKPLSNYLSKKYNIPFSNNRFIDFKKLKEKIYSVLDVNIADELHRSIFIHDFLTQNASSEPPMLKNILAQKYAKNFRFIESYLTKILPQLKPFFDLEYDSQIQFPKNYTEDLKIIKDKYVEFLKSNNLAEKSWDKYTIIDNINKYIFVYPETFGDFHHFDLSKIKYEIIDLDIKTMPSSYYFDQAGKIIKTNSIQDCPLRVYKNQALEFQQVMAEIHSLKESGISFNDIIITVAKLQNIYPYLEKEALNFNIKLQRRFSSSITEFPITGIFDDISSIVSDNMTYDDIERFLLNPVYPLKHRSHKDSLIYQFLEIGRKKNCYSNMPNSKFYKDTWYVAIKYSLTEDEKFQTQEILDYYKKLKGFCYGITSAKTFKNLKKKINGFFNYFFITKEDEYARLDLSLENENVFKKMLNSLTKLEELEQSGYTVDDKPFYFFMKYISSQSYNYPPVYDESVRVYNYGSSFCIPSKYHFILNLSDGNYDFNQINEVKFVSKDLLKNTSLSKKEEYITNKVLDLYLTCSEYVICSCSELTYNKYKMPSVAFLKREKLQEIKNINSKYNYTYTEKQKWSRLNTDAGAIKLVKNQISSQGFKNFINKNEKNEDLFCKASLEKIKDRLIKNNDAIISALRINRYYECKRRFFYDRIFNVFAPRGIDLQNPMEYGNFYHNTIQYIYDKLVELGYTLHEPKSLENSISILRDVEKNDMFSGSIHKPIFEIYKDASFKNLENFIRLMFEKFHLKPLGENEKSINSQNQETLGRIDKLIIFDKEIIIIDYKKKISAKHRGAFSIDNIKTNDLQLLIYGINRYSVDKNMYLYYIGIEDLEVEESKLEDIPKLMKFIEYVINKYKNDIIELNFSKTSYKKIKSEESFYTVKDIQTSKATCQNCDKLPVCRNLYSL